VLDQRRRRLAWHARTGLQPPRRTFLVGKPHDRHP
jgi:hypothetical protein